MEVREEDGSSMRVKEREGKEDGDDDGDAKGKASSAMTWPRDCLLKDFIYFH